MTILNVYNNNPLIDGRQSERAMLVRKGVQLLLHDMRHAVLPELPLASGRRADLISLSEKGEIWIIEIKTSIEDFRVDRKWPEYRQHCDRMFFATHKDVPLDIFPADMLDRLEVTKSLTPNMEGDAIGGAVNMVMKDAPSTFTVNATAPGPVGNEVLV